MPNTSTGLPYPAETDTPDVPRDVGALAGALDDRAVWASTITQVPDANGGINVPHGLGVAPGVAVVSVRAGASGNAVLLGAQVESMTSTVVRVRVFAASGAPFTSSVTVYVLACRTTT